MTDTVYQLTAVVERLEVTGGGCTHTLTPADTVMPVTVAEYPIELHVAGVQGPRGPQGADGYVGSDGKSAFEVWQEQPGNEGKDVNDFLNYLGAIPGPPGEKGKDGQIRFTGTGPPPQVIVGAEPGDTYLDLDTGDIYKL